MVPVIGNSVGVQVRVYDNDVPLAMGRHLGHGGGHLVVFGSVGT